MSEHKTPWNPSKTAIAKVKNPLPAPTLCPHCGDNVHIEPNSNIYGKSYGEWPWAYVCEDDECDSYVGMHPYTDIPLGTLANKQIREARKQAKSRFHFYMNENGLSRTQAYQKLAECMHIDVNECHFGWFDVSQCQQAENYLNELIDGNEIKADSPFAVLANMLNK